MLWYRFLLNAVNFCCSSDPASNVMNGYHSRYNAMVTPDEVYIYTYNDNKNLSYLFGGPLVVTDDLLSGNFIVHQPGFISPGLTLYMICSEHVRHTKPLKTHKHTYRCSHSSMFVA